MALIRPAAPAEAAWLQDSFDSHMAWAKPAGYFQALLDRQAEGDLLLLLALAGARYAGHCKIVWRSAYPGFRERGIPEIQDLNVPPDFRRRGIATRLLDEAERRLAERSDQAGIGFGLYADYGAAQRLYVKRGYVPDGRGVHHGGQPVVPGKCYPVADDLALYLVKRL